MEMPLAESDKARTLVEIAHKEEPSLDRPLLFVFDNFETVSNPVQTYNWIDTYIRTQNKVLITSRFREFRHRVAMREGYDFNP